MSGFSVRLNEAGEVELVENEKRKPFAEFKGKNTIAFPDNYTVVDLETTGLDVKFDSIIEASAIKIRNNEIVDKFSELIYTDYIDDFITQLTGITTEMVANARKEKDVMTDFFEFIGEDVIVGHNANFDMNLLYVSSLLNFKKYFRNDFIDTMRISKWIHPEQRHHALEVLSHNYKIDYSRAHRALNDCEITLSLFLQLKEEIISNFGDTKIFINQVEQKIKDSKRIKVSDIKSEVLEIDVDNPLFGKIVVFTGELERMKRREAMQIVVNYGGIVKNTLVKDTNYLVLGTQDYKKIKNGKSDKQRKAEELILKGKNIHLISEYVFYSMIDDYENMN